MPRRLAAGALFTAAVGVSLGALAAPAQADAFTPQHASRVAAYAPDRFGDNTIRHTFAVRHAPDDEFATRFVRDEPCACPPDRPSSFPARVVLSDRRDCPPDRDRIHDDEDAVSAIAYTVHRVGDDDRRGCPPDRVRPYTSGYTVGDDGRIGDRRDCGGHEHGSGHRHDRHDHDHHGHSGDGQRGR
jgi:hypothetical protein